MTRLPHETTVPFLVWVGMETDLIFNRGIDLPEFASFPLLETPKTAAILEKYVQDQIDLAASFGLGTILESTTWKANKDRAVPLGYTESTLREVNRNAITMLDDIRRDSGHPNVLVSANVGPRDDAYAPSDTMSPDDAQAYHSKQIACFARPEVDLISAYTLSNSGEAIGIARACADVGKPCVIAFTVEIDGRLPSGQILDDAIAQTDAETDSIAEYYMINCAHPDHFGAHKTLNPRIGGIVVNASRCSHAELDESETLDAGDPAELGDQVGALLRANPALRVFGGCCGTDMRHLKSMAETTRNL